MRRARSAQGENGRLRMATARPGVVNQEHMGTLGQPVICAEVFWVDVAWVLDVGGGREMDLGAKCGMAEDPMQWMLTRAWSAGTGRLPSASLVRLQGLRGTAHASTAQAGSA